VNEGAAAPHPRKATYSRRPLEEAGRAAEEEGMATADPKTVQEMVEAVRKGKLSRRKLIVALTALGVTGAGAATVAAVTHRPTTSAAAQQQHLKLHDQHVTRQTRGDVNHMMSDYAADAIVDDPLFERPFVGVAAIAQRYAAEVASVPDRALTITNRIFAGEQLIVEWVATGTHVADYLGFGGTGRPFRLTGVTVVTRREGKIVRESHYFDVAELRRQVEA
jgi:steroid delta-isomerase-like uncharacterized protein